MKKFLSGSELQMLAAQFETQKNTNCLRAQNMRSGSCQRVAHMLPRK